MVPLASWLWMLALKRRHEHAAGASILLVILTPLNPLSQSFEQLHHRCVAVVVDPIQSVKGKVVIDAFRLINPQTVMMQQEPRQTTSNIGYLHKPSIQALIHGLNRHYYSIAINFRKTDAEQTMLLNLHKQNWTDGLLLKDFEEHSRDNEAAVTVSQAAQTLILRSLRDADRKCYRWRRHTTSQCRKSRHSAHRSSRRDMSASKIRNGILKTQLRTRWVIRSSKAWESCCTC